MKNGFKKFSLLAGRVFLSLTALLFLALITIQVALVIGVNILSTGKGTSYISKKINEAVAPSGYQIAFDTLYYDPVRGLMLQNLSVSDKEGEFLTLDKFKFRPSFAFGAVRILGLSASGGTLALTRLPKSELDQGNQEQEILQPFTTPDIYFHTISLSDLSFDRVVLSKDVLGTDLTFSPSMRAKVTLKEQIDLRLSFLPGLPELAPGVESPEHLKLVGQFVPSTLNFSIDTLSLTAPSYTVSAQGNGSLLEEGLVEIIAKAAHKDLTPLTQNAIKSASANLIVAGPIKGPAIELNASLITNSLKDRGLNDIDLTIKTSDITQGMNGHANIKTEYKDNAVHIESDLSYSDSILNLTNIVGSAPDLTLSGHGALSTETLLFDGYVSLTADDLSKYSDLAGTNLSGQLKAIAQLKPFEETQQSADISIDVANGTFDQFKIRSLTAEAFFASLSSPWPQSAKISAADLIIDENTALDKLNASVISADNLKYKLTLNGSGRAPAPLSFDGTALLSDLTQTIPTAENIALSVKQGSSTAKLSGDFRKDSVDLIVTAKDVRGADLVAIIPESLQNVRIDLQASMTGAPSAPTTKIDSTLRGLASGVYQDAAMFIQATHVNDLISATINGKGTGIRKLEADVSLPMTFAVLPFNFSLDSAAPIKGAIDIDADLAGISTLFLPPTLSLSGKLQGDGIISGTISDPAPTVNLRLSDVQFDDPQNGIVIANLNAEASLTKDALLLTSLSATDGKDGMLNGNGNLRFDGSVANIDMHMRGFNIPQSDLANGTISADLAFKGTNDGMILSGKADISEMNVLIPETFSSRIPQLNIVEDDEKSGPSLLERLAIDINIDANNQVFVRGWGLDAEFGGDISISGTASKPQFNGSLSARRGRYEEFGKRFDLARADLRFQGDVPPSPYLDIEATTPAGDVTGSVLLSGPVQAPSIKFASSPALPEDEVLSRILFGKESTRISPFQAVQLAQTIRRFSGQGGGSGLDPLGLLRSATGLDDISVEMDETGAANVGAGKYLADNVYLEVSKGKGDTSGEATIQIEVTPSINIESQIGQDAQGGGGIFWKKDY
jgi:translocation and assembly module TamB